MRISYLKDTAVTSGYKMLNLMAIAKMGFKHGPFDMIRDVRRYPWLLDLAKVNRLVTKLSRSRSGNYRKAVGMMLNGIVKEMVDQIEGIFHRQDKLVLHEDMVPPEILLPMIVPNVMEEYIDAAENEGIPADVCSLPKTVIGLAVKDRLPHAKAVVTSNLPCDGGMSSYIYVEKQIKAPVFRLDIPHNFKDERAEIYFAGELKKMIAWLEEHTTGRIDWAVLKEICEERNRMMEYELQLWEMIAARPAPLAADAVYISHLWFYNVCSGLKSSTEIFRRLVMLAEENLKNGVAAVPDEKYRALLWNPPTMHVIDLFAVAEERYGVTCIMDSMSFNRLPFIDTSSRESILQGIGRYIMNGPMARHTRGPMENYFDDIFHIIKRFGIDMLWMAGGPEQHNERKMQNRGNPCPHN